MDKSIYVYLQRNKAKQTRVHIHWICGCGRRRNIHRSTAAQPRNPLGDISGDECHMSQHAEFPGLMGPWRGVYVIVTNTSIHHYHSCELWGIRVLSVANIPETNFHM